MGAPLTPLLALLVMPIGNAVAEDGWTDLTGKGELSAWKVPARDWIHGGDAKLDPTNPRKLIADPATPGRKKNRPAVRSYCKRITGRSLFRNVRIKEIRQRD